MHRFHPLIISGESVPYWSSCLCSSECWMRRRSPKKTGFLGTLSSSFDPRNSRQFCPKMAETSPKCRRDRNVPSQPLCHLSGSTKRHHPVKCFVMAASSLSRNPCVYPFGGLGGEGGGGVCFQNGSIVARDWLARLTVQVWSTVTMTASQENGTSGMLCVCINRKADIWTAGSGIHSGVKEN